VRLGPLLITAKNNFPSPIKGGLGLETMHVIGSSRTPPLVEEEDPFQNMQKFGKNKNMFMDPTGPETMMDFAGEPSTNLLNRSTCT
jgi:hypothetical protein